MSLAIHFRIFREEKGGYRTNGVDPPSKRTLPSLPLLRLVLDVWLLCLQEPLEETVMQRVETHAQRVVSRR